MAHIHTCADCEGEFHCDEREVDSADGGECSVEPARCQDCQQSLDERNNESSLSRYYGGSGDSAGSVSAFCARALAEKRGR